MKKYLIKNKLKTAFPIMIKSFRGPNTTVVLPVKKGIELWDYQITGDIKIKENNKFLEIVLAEDFSYQKEAEIKQEQAKVQTPKEEIVLKEEVVVHEEVKAKKGRPKKVKKDKE